MKMPSVMKGGHFDRLPKVEIPRSQFDRSHGVKTTFDAGWLVPLMVDECLPGDSFNVKMAAFARLSTPIKPVMDNMFFEWFAFFVPYRLVWDNFEKFMGAQDAPGASTDYLLPQVSAHDVMLHSLSDYVGLPRRGGAGTLSDPVNALPFRAYNLIWNEWFRDQNLQAKVAVPTGDGPDDVATVPYTLLKRGKRGDYFTTCLPFAQKGNAVRLPMANVGVGGVTFGNIVGDGLSPTMKNSSGAAATGKVLTFGVNAATGAVNFGGGAGSPAASNPMLWDTPHLILNSGEMGTINQLRQAVQVQRLLEREARGGTRYVEWTKAVFGVSNPDFRLQRPEFLGSGSSGIVVSPVAQTGPTVALQTPQGNLAGVGTLSVQGQGFAKSVTEHGVLLVLGMVRADLNYQQNLDRMWTRRTKLDLAMPVTAHLGEQAVLNKEILYTGTPATDDAVFGYQERFAEYRFKQSQITGLFRSQVAGTLDIWHLAQNFSVTPTLGPTFIQEDPPIDRVIAVPTEPHFLFDAYFKSTWARCLPTYSVPGMMDHF